MLALAIACYSSANRGLRVILAPSGVSIEVADKLAKYFGITLDELVHMTEKIPNEVTIVDKSVSERINLIQQLEEEDKQALFRIIDSMLTKSKFKDFFDKNMASL
jgi:transcriptional regulator with XRE-family HTH domain